MKRNLGWLVMWGTLAGAGAGAQPVACHVAYAGAVRTVVVAPSTHAEPTDPQLTSSSIAVEIVNRLPPAPGAGVTVRTLSVREGQPQLLHQASYLPGAPVTGPHGFTGLQVVREPVRGNELTYWCEHLPPRQ
jgi:uncharacterized membrane protein